MEQPINYKQYDSLWKDVSYSNADESTTIGRAGCGTTCSAMVIATLKDSTVTPITTSKWSLEHGYKYTGGGTYYSYFKPQFAEYGLTCKQLNSVNLRTQSRANSVVYHNEALQALKDGNLVIACMGKGNWTTSGHYILIYDYQDGNIFVNDPASSKTTRAKNTFELACQQVKYWWTIEVPKETEDSSTIVALSEELAIANNKLAEIKKILE